MTHKFAKVMDIYKKIAGRKPVRLCKTNMMFYVLSSFVDTYSFKNCRSLINMNHNTNASQRITELFIELLDRQFPVDYPHSVLSLRTPADYANRLSIHVNHLNKVVKDTTGKTTSTMIAERIIKECTQYLLHSNFSISEIAYSLGFENIAYFSKFYRKHTGKSPSEIREQQLFDLCK